MLLKYLDACFVASFKSSSYFVTSMIFFIVFCFVMCIVYIVLFECLMMIVFVLYCSLFL